MGTESSEQMIHEAEVENQVMTWIIRLITLTIMIIGIGLLLAPLSVIAESLLFVLLIARKRHKENVNAG
jgi:hypothetical protein